MKKVNTTSSKYFPYSSESTSSYLSCISSDDQLTSSGLMKSSTKKSKLYIKDLFREDTFKSSKNIEPLSSHSVSTKTLCVLSHKQKKLQRDWATCGRFSEELPLIKYSSKTSCNKTSTKRLFSTTSLFEPRRKKDKFIMRSFTQCTTVWESTYRKTGRQLDASHKTESLKNKSCNEFCQNASLSKSCISSVKERKLSANHQLKNSSVSCRNNEKQSVAMSLKLNTILNTDILGETDDESTFLRKWRVNNLLDKFKLGEEKRSCDRSVSIHDLRNETNLFLCNTVSEQRKERNIEYELFHRCLHNSSSSIKKFDILQSLILRLTNQESVERHATVQAIIDNDLFGINRKCGVDTILKNLLWPLNVRTPHPLQASTAKLLNALVSYQIGREYFNQMSMVNLLTWSDSELMFESMADNLMAVMMKLSLSQIQRSDMLKKGLLQWLIDHMEKVEFTASTFHLECMTDLLRMLLDVEYSIEYSSVKIPQLIIVLVRYMNVENDYVKTNVCHALRALFRNSTAVKIGNKIHMHRIIQDHIKKTSNPKLKEDLKFIYKVFITYKMNKSCKHGSSSPIIDPAWDQDYEQVNKDQEFNLTSVKKSKMPLKYYSEPYVNIQKDEGNSVQPTDHNVGYCENYHHNGVSESTQFSKAFDQGLLNDINSYISKVCLDKESTTNVRSASNKYEIVNSETEDDTTDESEIISIKSGNTFANKRNQQIGNNDVVPTPHIIFSNLNWKLEQNSSLLNSNSVLNSYETREYVGRQLKKKCIDKSVAVDMEDKSENVAVKSTSQLESSKPNNMKSSTNSIDFSDFNSIAKDPKARNEILESDSFLDELCEKVLNKLRTKLFCGPNCNTNCCGKKSDEMDKV